MINFLVTMQKDNSGNTAKKKRKCEDTAAVAREYE